jgi:predicted enzyme related to lactoylglutathione lyase
MSATHGTFVWYELLTTDPVAARSFYAQLLGWRSEPQPGRADSVFHSGATPLGGVTQLPAQLRARGAAPAWQGYVEVDNLEQALARVQALGGTLHRGITRAGDRGHYAVVADPLGAEFCLHRSMRPPVPDFSMAPGHVAWRELRSPDWQRGFGFYHVLLGWERGDVLATPGRKYQVFKTASTAAGGMVDMAGLTTSVWQYYFAVENIDAAATRIAAAGGRVIEGPQPITGGMWILEAGDPQGAAFALLGPR